MNVHPNFSSLRSRLRHPGHTIRALGRRFIADRSGATAVLAILLTPIIVLAFWGGFSIWKVIQIRDSLHHGNYEAARFLSLYAPEDPNEDLWSGIAQTIVVQELMNNPFTAKAGDNISSVDLEVKVDLLSDTRECKDKFTVTSKYVIRALPVGSQQVNTGLPNLELITLEDERDGEVLCQ